METKQKQKVSAKCANVTGSEAEWRRIGNDDEVEFVVVENRHMKSEGSNRDSQDRFQNESTPPC